MQASLAAGIRQEPTIVSTMYRGQRLTGAQARERVLSIISWLHKKRVLDSAAEANALLAAASNNSAVSPPKNLGVRCDAIVARAQQELGPDRFEACWQAGQRVSMQSIAGFSIDG